MTQKIGLFIITTPNIKNERRVGEKKQANIFI